MFQFLLTILSSQAKFYNPNDVSKADISTISICKEILSNSLDIIIVSRTYEFPDSTSSFFSNFTAKNQRGIADPSLVARAPSKAYGNQWRSEENVL
jgi:hypothetical protein